MVSLACATALNAFVPYVLKMIVDSAQTMSQTGSAVDLYRAAYTYVGVSIGSVLLWRLGAIAGMYWATGARATGRQVLSAYATLHSHSYFSNRFSGSLANKIKHASSGLRAMSGLILWQFVGFTVSISISFGLAFYTSPMLAAVLLCWAIIITPLNIYFSKKRVPLSRAAERAETALSGATVDMLSNISAVHEYARRDFEIDRLKEMIDVRRIHGVRNWSYGERVLLFNGVLQSAFAGVMVLGAAYYVEHGMLTAGELVLLVTVVLMIADKITMVGNQLNELAEVWGEIHESLDELLHEHDVQDVQDARALKIDRGDLQFDAVSFGYAGTEIFKELTLHIPPGQKVGLVGKSGAGKTTLMKLLLRHYDTMEGVVSIDGQNIRSVTKESLRTALAVVPQEPILFHRTIRENIAYGKADATDEDIKVAAEKAQAHVFIEKVPGSYDAMVGERGVKLSGGQKQRVAIARAFLKNAPILLLDEATSALDSESEIAVQRALAVLMEQRTVIAIAHRLSTLRAMDRILVLDEGVIIEDGTHDELVQRGGVYASLWEQQAGGFIREDSHSEET